MERLQQLRGILNTHALSTVSAWLTEQSVSIQQIPAPTFHEAERAFHIMQQMRALELECVEIDDIHNVYGMFPGQDGQSPYILVSAHTDTIFSMQTDLSLRREANILYAPGLGDNSIGVGALLALARFLRDERITPKCNIWFVATVREEGLGDLGGMKAAFERLRAGAGAVINIEGLAYGHVYNSGIAVRRLEIVARSAGGHSWLHFGRPSAIHTLLELGARICSIRPPAAPRTTYNIGLIAGGTAVNAIAQEARMWLDLRSETRSGVEQIEQQVQSFIRAQAVDDVTIDVQIVGDRPPGALAAHHPLVQDALAALRLLGVQSTLETGSTDANIPLAAGCPAVTIGITRGGNAHRIDEYIELTPVADGLQQLILLTLITAERLAGVS